MAGRARSKCVTDVGHEVQLPLGPSTRLCLETIRYERGHNLLPPLGPSTGRLSEKLGFAELTIDNGQLTIVVSLRDEFESPNDPI